MRVNPITLDNKKLDLKTHLITLNVKDRLYLLLSKGVIRKGLANFTSKSTDRLAVLSSIKAQSQSFKYKKHSEYSVNSLNYIMSIFTSRKQSNKGKSVNTPENEGDFFKRIQNLIALQIEKNLTGKGIIKENAVKVSDEAYKAKEVFQKAYAMSNNNVSLIVFFN